MIPPPLPSTSPPLPNSIPVPARPLRCQLGFQAAVPPALARPRSGLPSPFKAADSVRYRGSGPRRGEPGSPGGAGPGGAGGGGGVSFHPRAGRALRNYNKK